MSLLSENVRGVLSENVRCRVAILTKASRVGISLNSCQRDKRCSGAGLAGQVV
jgi:hypothetical protein